MRLLDSILPSELRLVSTIVSILMASSGCAHTLPQTKYVTKAGQLRLGDLEIHSRRILIHSDEILTYLKANGAMEDAAQAELDAIEAQTGCSLDGGVKLSHGIVMQCKQRLDGELARKFVDSFDVSPISEYDPKKNRWSAIAPQINEYIGKNVTLYYFAAEALDEAKPSACVNAAPPITDATIALDPIFWATYKSSNCRSKFELAADRLTLHLNRPKTKSAYAEMPELVLLILGNLAASRDLLRNTQTSRALAYKYIRWLEEKFEYYPILATLVLEKVQESKPQRDVPTEVGPPQMFDLIIQVGPSTSISIPLQIHELKITEGEHTYQLESEPQRAITPLNYADSTHTSTIRWSQFEVVGAGKTVLSHRDSPSAN